MHHTLYCSCLDVLFPTAFPCSFLSWFSPYRKTCSIVPQVESDGKLYSVPADVEMVSPPSKPFLEVWWKVINSQYTPYPHHDSRF